MKASELKVGDKVILIHPNKRFYYAMEAVNKIATVVYIHTRSVSVIVKDRDGHTFNQEIRFEWEDAFIPEAVYNSKLYKVLK